MEDNKRNMKEKKPGGRVHTATGVITRVIKYMLHYYKGRFAIVILCILITAIATVIGATFPQTLVDDYIAPMLDNGHGQPGNHAPSERRSLLQDGISAYQVF